MNCRYCGYPIFKALFGWYHVKPPYHMHIARPK